MDGRCFEASQSLCLGRREAGERGQLIAVRGERHLPGLLTRDRPVVKNDNVARGCLPPLRQKFRPHPVPAERRTQPT